MLATLGNRTAQHDRYTVRVMRNGQHWRARAFAGAMRIANDAEGASAEEAIARLVGLLEQHLALHRAARDNGIPGVEEFCEGLSLLWSDFSIGQQQMLVAHARDPLLTATELAAAANYRSYETASLKYGEVGKRFARALSIPLATRERDETDVYTSAIATGGPKGENGHWCWRMHPSLVQALRRMGYA